jgi:hypothetical protein
VSILPACDSIFSASGFSRVEAENLEWVEVPAGSESDPGLGRYDASLEPVLSDNDRVSCNFILPASERGMTTDAFIMTASDRATVAAFFEGAGYTQNAASAGGTIFSIDVPGEYPFTEAHLFRDDLLVSSFDYFGTSAVDYVNDASSQIALLSTP